MRVSKMMLIAAAVFSVTTVSAPSFAKGPSTAGLQHSNKGGALRGLDRANSVAGSHGQAGRTNAASHH